LVEGIINQSIAALGVLQQIHPPYQQESRLDSLRTKAMDVNAASVSSSPSSCTTPETEDLQFDGRHHERAPLLLPTKIMDAADEKGERPDLTEDTAHQISVDPWYQVGFVLITGVNSAYVLGYSGSIMVPLGWIAGTCGLLLAAAISMYANALLARLHEVGGKRHIRYRDLAGHIYGRKIYGLTWALQYVNLFMINTGFIILAGQALKVFTKITTDAARFYLFFFST